MYHNPACSIPLNSTRHCHTKHERGARHKLRLCRALQELCFV